jgi:hypothetical protein
MQTDVHALSAIRTHEPSVRASEDILCLTPRGHCDRLYPVLLVKYYHSRSVSHESPRESSVTLVKAADFRSGIGSWNIKNTKVERTECHGIVDSR